MNDADTVQEIVDELNRTRYRIIDNAKEFVKQGNNIIDRSIDKSSKDKQSFEKIAEIVKKAHDDAIKTLPEIEYKKPLLKPADKNTDSVKDSSSKKNDKVETNTADKPVIEIFKPSNGNILDEGDSIDLKFRAKNINPPFRYRVLGKEKTGLPFKILESESKKDTIIELKNIKKENIEPLYPGEYTIRVELVSKEKGSTVGAGSVYIRIRPKPAPKTPRVKIKRPSNDAPFEAGDKINLEFETEDTTIFSYYITAIDSSKRVIPIKFSTTSDKKKLVEDLKEKNVKPLQEGTYTLRVRILDPTTKKDIAPPDEVVIHVGPKKLVPGEHTISMVSPTEKDGPYTQPLIVEFKVGGKHHDDGKDYSYTIFVTKDGKDIWHGGDITNHKDVIHTDKIDGLPGGEYVIEIQTKDITTGTILKSLKEPFVIKTIEPIRIIKNITINNQIINYGIKYDVPIPFYMPLDIKLELTDPKYITQIADHPLDMHIEITDSDSGKAVISPIDEPFSSRYILQGPGIPIIKAGIYNMVVIISDRGEEIFKKAIEIEINDKNDKNPKPVKKRNNALFTILIGGKSYESGKTHGTQLKINGRKPSIITIKNSGKGGNIVWRAVSDPWLEISPSRGQKPLSNGESEDIAILVKDKDLKEYPSMSKGGRTGKPKYGRLMIIGAYGKKVTQEDWKATAGRCLINFELIR